MKTAKELNEFAQKYKRIDSHVHTHLCDGKKDMTVNNIAGQAVVKGLDAVILTPHFHKRISDGADSLYTDSDETIFMHLREEIERYEKEDGRIKFLLSTEADIISAQGDLSLDISADAEMALDAVTPTLNYHPLLPLKFVGLTMGKHIDALHESGEYARASDILGGTENVLTTMYRAEGNAIAKCEYPCILGHFFAPHSVHPDKYTWFDAREEHLPLMLDETNKLVEICRQKQALIDITGVHMQNYDTVESKMAKNGFMVDFQRFVLSVCARNGVNTLFGSDAHSLASIAKPFDYYYAL